MGALLHSLLLITWVFAARSQLKAHLSACRTGVQMQKLKSECWKLGVCNFTVHWVKLSCADCWSSMVFLRRIYWPYTKDSRKKPTAVTVSSPVGSSPALLMKDISNTAPAVTCLSPGSVLGKGSSLLYRPVLFSGTDAVPRSAWLDVAGARQGLLAPCPCYQKRALIQGRRQMLKHS